MKYFWTFFWTFLLVQMMSYVTGNMVGVQFDFLLGTIVSVGVTALILLIASLIPSEPDTNSEAQ